MGQTISGWNPTGWKPSGSDYYKYYRTILNWSYSNDRTTFVASANTQFNCKKVTADFTGTQIATNQTTSTGTGKSNFSKNIVTGTLVARTYYWARDEEDYNVTISGAVQSWNGKWCGEATWASVTFTVPKLDRINITYDGNDAAATNVPSPQTKYYSKPLTITSQTPSKGSGSAFVGWNTERDGSGTTYLPDQDFTNEPSVATESLTLYAQWTWVNQPTCDVGDIKDTSNFINPTKNFSTIAVDLTNVQTHAEGRTPVNCYLKVGGTTSSAVQPNAQGKATVSVTPTESGILSVSVILVDTIDGEAGARQEYPLEPITVENPTWSQTVTFDTDMPDIGSDGKANMTVTVYDYDEEEYVDLDSRFDVKGVDGNWSFDIELTENYVNGYTEHPTTSIKATYNHSESNEKDYRTAFYGTTRNANYSTGIANTMFVSGCSYPNFSSRVWWSQVNNPLYFPDTNYVEVGSNDTSVQGLIKVGDYLGAIKQSKTTDTAIYLLYPTSFDDETTYAVKQGVQGVGALAKYSFNILGDETLFLSPNGIVAIVPSEDEEHKVQNRSFYVDGKLLKEDDIKNAYSFVHDGKYWLSVGGHCYVLDGNQKNSWGNDKTNLVYECYYLDNIPANCFVKYHDELWFSDSEYLCRFTDDSYYDSQDGEKTPVKAEWSTILDDDGSLHYYKTMNKKGNVVSVLPRASEHTEVLIKKDNEEPVLIQRTFSEASDIPSELYVNKKFKKYKRLQIIVRNEKAEGFGVDSIVKSYSLGSYAKR